MPTCLNCGITQATVMMRRSPKKDEEGATLWLCKDKGLCKQRRAAKRANEIALRQGRS